MGTYEWDGTSPAAAVVEAVAEESDCDPAELATLYRVIDPDALEAFLDPRSGTEADRRVEFDYAGYAVAVTDDGLVEVTRAEAPLVG
jgi:hypothetical protein